MNSLVSRILLIFPLAIFCFALVGCGGNNTESPSLNSPGTPAVITVSVSPQNTTGTVNVPVQFTATVAGTSNKGVTWAFTTALPLVKRTGGTSISSTGSFVTDTAGTYTIKATSTADASVSGTATVVINPAAAVGDWTIVLAQEEDGLKPKPITRTPPTDLGTLQTVTSYPGFNYPSFGQFTTFSAEALDGFTGTITLTDVPSGTADHLACQFATSGTPSSSLALTPTTAGVNFTVSYTIPSNYTYASTTLKFQASDTTGRTKTVEIAVKLQNFQSSFAQVTLQNTGNGSGTLVITPNDLVGFKPTITFDTNILVSDNVPAAFNHPLPTGVTVSTTTPTITTGTGPTSVPVNFTWQRWQPGDYTVIAVISLPITVGGQGILVRVPCEVAVLPGT